MGSELKEEELEPARARELIATEGAQPLDLRDEDEYAEVRIAGTVRASEDDLDEALESIDQDRPVVVVCEDGERSAQVAADLRDRGYQAAALKGGMKAWTGDKHPTIPRDTEEFHGPRRPGPLGS
ncbi:MAG: rhodanese-like domain-containing protein [Solirubrobacterales bacterium]